MVCTSAIIIWPIYVKLAKTYMDIILIILFKHVAAILFVKAS